MHTNKLWLPLILVALVLATGCPSTNDDGNEDPLDAMDMTEDNDDMVEECSISCDLTDDVAILVNVNNTMGSDYCAEPYEVTAEYTEGDPFPYTKTCSCGTTAWPDGGRPDVGQSLTSCDFSFFPGDKIAIEVDVTGYETMRKELTVKCECASEQTVTFDLAD